MENLVKQGWRVIREWRNRFGNHWVLLTPEGRIWSGVDNVRNKSKAWRRLIVTVPPNKGLQSDGARVGAKWTMAAWVILIGATSPKNRPAAKTSR